MSAAPGRARVHVGFRYWTCDQADRLGLGGWVRNLGDGRVEAVFEGPAAEVAQAVAWCRQGPADAWVSDLRTEPETPVGESSVRARSSSYGGDDS